MEWSPSFILTIAILFASIIGGYAVLRKRVRDLEQDTEKKLDEDKHTDLCKIASLEMKGHVSNAMKKTFDGFEKEVFDPAITQILKAINGE